MLRNTIWAGQKGLKALTAALKKNENKFIKKWYKNKIQRHNTTNWQTQTIGLQGTGKNQMNLSCRIVWFSKLRLFHCGRGGALVVTACADDVCVCLVSRSSVQTLWTAYVTERASLSVLSCPSRQSSVNRCWTWYVTVGRRTRNTDQRSSRYARRSERWPTESRLPPCTSIQLSQNACVTSDLYRPNLSFQTACSLRFLK